MRERSPEVGLSGLKAREAIGLISSHLRLQKLLFGHPRPGSGNDVTYESCADLWRDIMREQLRVTATINLKDFWLSEWFPLRPGLFHANPSARRRYMARGEIISTPGVSPAELERRLGLSADSISPETARRVLGNRHTAIYSPNGKTMMLDGGIGCIRLNSKRLVDGDVWFMGAASEPVAHQGIPVALPDSLYRKHIGQIAASGAIRCTLAGELRYLPDELQYPHRYLAGIPQVYILVKDLRLSGSLSGTTLEADGAVLIQTSPLMAAPDDSWDPVPGVFAAYVTFRPGIPDAVNRAARWLADDYVGELLGGRVLTDFDEQVRRFGDAIFSLEHVMTGRVPVADASRLISGLTHSSEAEQLTEYIANANVHITTIIGSHNAVASGGSAAATGDAAANDFHGTATHLAQSRALQEKHMPDEVILIEIAAALAAKATESLYELVRNKFRSRKQALEALQAADGAAKDSPQVTALAEELATAEAYDPTFSEQLRAQWAAFQSSGAVSDGGVANSINGPVTGNVVQARDIQGNITF